VSARRWYLLAVAALLGSAFGALVAAQAPSGAGGTAGAAPAKSVPGAIAGSAVPAGAAPLTGVPGAAVAVFASGCFWCTESDFEKLPGVISAESGYIGGNVDRPTYRQVSAGRTGHTEAVRVVYDPAKVSYERLLEHFWRNVDPTVKDAQFCDVGSQYRSGIFYVDAEQKRAAEASRAVLEATKRFPRIFTEVTAATTFWLAEDYHQDYAKRNPVRYQLYRSGCGRDARLAELWGK
jgi:peptide-methionine (S)-S-oxide reductase